MFCQNISIRKPAVPWLKYCWCGVKHYSINPFGNVLPNRQILSNSFLIYLCTQNCDTLTVGINSEQIRCGFRHEGGTVGMCITRIDVLYRHLEDRNWLCRIFRHRNGRIQREICNDGRAVLYRHRDSCCTCIDWTQRYSVSTVGRKNNISRSHSAYHKLFT